MSEAIDVRVVLERRGGKWFWKMTCAGEEHVGQRSEPTIDLAAIAADTFRRQLELAEHFRKMKAERSKHSAPPRA